jgi:hypothetical protein
MARRQDSTFTTYPTWFIQTSTGVTVIHHNMTLLPANLENTNTNT